MFFAVRKVTCLPLFHCPLPGPSSLDSKTSSVKTLRKKKLKKYRPISKKQNQKVLQTTSTAMKELFLSLFLLSLAVSLTCENKPQNNPSLKEKLKNSKQEMEYCDEAEDTYIFQVFMKGSMWMRMTIAIATKFPLRYSRWMGSPFVFQM